MGGRRNDTPRNRAVRLGNPDAAGWALRRFLYQGPANAGATVFRYILQEWLPASAYMLDNRPHFEVLGEKYTNEGSASEEGIWIPIQLRSAYSLPNRLLACPKSSACFQFHRFLTICRAFAGLNLKLVVVVAHPRRLQ